MNNIRVIREIYNANQTEVSEAIGVSRITIAKWEKDDNIRVSKSKIEKLSYFFGIKPEYFYDKEIDEKVIKILQFNRQKSLNTANRNGDCFDSYLVDTSFKDVVSKFQAATRMLLATVEKASIEELEIICKINDRTNAMLNLVIQDKKKENISMDDLFSKILD